ncbi:hypothetical protein Rs2_16415 [Raphanus sativus]|uniref:Heat stress transcription factor A-6a n=1 Tax=Raphanus sativus TaxID=3726 RepID=A0A6J0NA32_RAPSA|nr:heat stress transcription factor A-6a [Raphanus sativus]KAJ4902464.1 hypothetical protein Rs2_16415 [Raphanus sativus]
MVRKLPTRSSSSFFLQLYQVVNDRSSDPIISWSKSNNHSFVVWDLKKLHILLKSSSVLGRTLTAFWVKLSSNGFRSVEKGPGVFEFEHDDFARGPLMKKMMVKPLSERIETEKMMVKALSERIERFDAQIKIIKCRLKAKKASLNVETLFQNLRI